MAEAKTTCDNVATEKIKAFDPHIVVNRDANDPYYMIQYYDVLDKKWHLGFGSFNLSFVIQWLQEEFEEVEVELVEVKHGEWDASGRYNFADGSLAIRCSECGCALHLEEYEKYNWNYCPNCGAKMDGGTYD